MQTRVKTAIHASADHVWDIFAHDFENAYLWMSSVKHSYGKENGPAFPGARSQGRVCELSNDPNGMHASESFLAYDEENRTATVRIEIRGGPAVAPIKVNIMDVMVAAEGKDKASVDMTIRSQLKPAAYLFYPIVKLGILVFIRQIQEELKHFAERGTPHPRKVKALNAKTKSANATRKSA